MQDAQVQFRLSIPLKDALLSYVNNKGLTISQVMRNYIESLIDVSTLREEGKDKLSDTSSARLFCFRVSAKLLDSFQRVCKAHSLKMSGHIRTFMSDYVSMLDNSYVEAPHSFSLDYLLLFLKNEQQKRGLKLTKVDKRFFSKTSRPLLINIRDEKHIEVNDLTSCVCYTLIFEKL